MSTIMKTILHSGNRNKQYNHNHYNQKLANGKKLLKVR